MQSSATVPSSAVGAARFVRLLHWAVANQQAANARAAPIWGQFIVQPRATLTLL